VAAFRMDNALPSLLTVPVPSPDAARLPARLASGASAAAPAGEASALVADEVLARQWQAGSDAAFTELIARFHRRVFSFQFHSTQRREDAEDLTQETFLAAHRSVRRYQPERTFAPWLFGIARHALADHWRRARPHEELPADYAGQPGPEETTPTEADERGVRLWGQARRLKPQLFAALWLRYGEGFDIAAVARALDVTRIHAKVILFRARKELARRGRADQLTQKGDAL